MNFNHEKNNPPEWLAWFLQESCRGGWQYFAREWNTPPNTSMVLSILGFEICLISFYRSHPRRWKVNEIVKKPKNLSLLLLGIVKTSNNSKQFLTSWCFWPSTSRTLSTRTRNVRTQISLIRILELSLVSPVSYLK